MTSTTPLPSMMIIIGDPYTSYLIQTYAGACGYRPATLNGKDILAAVREQKPLAVILDTDLHEEAGWRTLQGLKMAPATFGIPVFTCSWADDGGRSRACGASGHLRKPVQYEDFATALAEAGVAPGKVWKGGEE